jgi:hypothetical protein
MKENNSKEDEGSGAGLLFWSECCIFASANYTATIPEA